MVYFDQHLLVFCAWNAQGRWFSEPLHKVYIWSGVISQYLYLQFTSSLVFILHLFSIRNQILNRSSKKKKNVATIKKRFMAIKIILGDNFQNGGRGAPQTHSSTKQPYWWKLFLKQPFKVVPQRWGVGGETKKTRYYLLPPSDLLIKQDHHSKRSESLSLPPVWEQNPRDFSQKKRQMIRMESFEALDNKTNFI